MRMMTSAVLVALAVISGTVVADTIEDTVVMQSKLCVAVKAQNAPQKCSDSEPRTVRLLRSIATAEDGTVSIAYSGIDPLPPGLTVPVTAKHSAGVFTLVTAAEPASPSGPLAKFLEADWPSINVETKALRDCAVTAAAPCAAIRVLTKIDAFDWYVSSLPGAEHEFAVVAKPLMDTILPPYSGRLLLTGNGIELTVVQTRQTERTVSISEGYSAVTVESATDNIKFTRVRNAS